MREPPDLQATESVGPVYSVEEAARILGIGRTFMFSLITSGQVESFKIGKRRRIAGTALDAYIQRLVREQAADR